MPNITKAERASQSQTLQKSIPKKGKYSQTTSTVRSKIKHMTIAFRALFHRNIALCKDNNANTSNKDAERFLIDIFKKDINYTKLVNLTKSLQNPKNRDDFQKDLQQAVDHMSSVDAFKIQKALQDKVNLEEIKDTIKNNRDQGGSHFETIVDKLHEHINKKISATSSKQKGTQTEKMTTDDLKQLDKFTQLLQKASRKKDDTRAPLGGKKQIP